MFPPFNMLLQILLRHVDQVDVTQMAVNTHIKQHELPCKYPNRVYTADCHVSLFATHLLSLRCMFLDLIFCCIAQDGLSQSGTSNPFNR